MDLTKAELLELLNDAQDARYKAATIPPKQGTLRRIWGAVVNIVLGLFLVSLSVALLVLLADRFGAIPHALVDRALGTPQTTFQTRQETQGGGRRPPTITPGLTSFYGAPSQPSREDQGMGGEPTATAAPAQLTADTHLTAIAIQLAPTETAQAVEWAAIEGPYFYDPYTLATPEPGFGGYVAGECGDKEKVKESFLLQQMCEGE